MKDKFPLIPEVGGRVWTEDGYSQDLDLSMADRDIWVNCLKPLANHKNVKINGEAPPAPANTSPPPGPPPPVPFPPSKRRRPPKP